MAMEPLLIGWAERTDFPDWGIEQVPVKIDTGARTAAIDARDLRFEDEAVTATLRLHKRGRTPRWATVRMPLVGGTRVRNSSGLTEPRPVVETTLLLGTVRRSVRMTLTRRPTMIYPILLGRTAIAQAFTVDAARKYLVRKSR
jgi:hypothetical protein